ncbi:NAD(P)-dependent oxidoreductase [Synechocystis salina LEGE 06099]|uniref:NAD(P)-dependent oxidoreductase n=1 Tax=Synechocystis salina TaxID=945780 RepID=UPI00187FB890|nr:NAD(P)-dependent oxidoreductase [Synechocystis salina]MBE9203209.1 NAD(P)-dependent oxidoreductase [Synechocystis salina LEGE 06099]
MKLSKIAVFGLGVMGSPMAQNLVKNGYQTVGYNRTLNRSSALEAVKAGVKVVHSIAEAVENADIILTCVGDEKDVQQLILGSGGIAESAKPQALIIDCSTIGKTAACDLATTLKAKGLRFLDAPVTGGDIGAINGTLTIMVGGELADFEEALPVLTAIGKKVVHCGPSGSGQAVKLCNQILCGIHAIATAEAIQLSKQLGIEPELVINVCGSGAAGSWALTNLGPKMSEADFAPGFMVKHLLKDLRLVREAAENGQLPGVTLAESLFESVQLLGGEDQGSQAIIRAYDET